ncbi:MAG: hypothetical protein L0Y70_08680, partial [Gemmataceae bacterium]|nr:hypothetical protein [Gemmataceae bacterium]
RFSRTPCAGCCGCRKRGWRRRLMKNRDQVIREYVIRAMADSDEDFATIVTEVTQWASKKGMAVDRQTILKKLGEVIKEGYGQALAVSPERPNIAEPTEFSPERVDDLWFYVTPKGKKLLDQLTAEDPSIS